MTEQDQIVEEVRLAFARQDLMMSFQRLGITKKLKEIKPVLDAAKLNLRHEAMTGDSRSNMSKLIDFIMTLDEPLG